MSLGHVFLRSISPGYQTGKIAPPRSFSWIKQGGCIRPYVASGTPLRAVGEPPREISLVFGVTVTPRAKDGYTLSGKVGVFADRSGAGWSIQCVYFNPREERRDAAGALLWSREHGYRNVTVYRAPRTVASTSAR